MLLKTKLLKFAIKKMNSGCNFILYNNATKKMGKRRRRKTKRYYRLFQGIGLLYQEKVRVEEISINESGIFLFLTI
jgi:hypothetical protein